MSSKKPIDEKVSNIPPFGLRMLPGMKERISRAAAENGRSMNAEIVRRLQESLDFDDHRQYAPTPSSEELQAFGKAIGHGSTTDIENNLNPIDQVLFELRKLQMTVSSFRLGPNGESVLVTEPKLLQAERTDEQQFPDPTDEDVLRKMADRFGYELTPKKDET